MTAGSGGDDASWEGWCTAFDFAQRDVQRLFHNRHVWLAINEMWRRSWDDIGLNVVVQNWFITQYVHTQCTGIRRECDARTDTSSLRRCLQRLLDRPQMADRARYESAIRALPDTPPEYVPELLRGFDQFAAGPREPYLDAERVQGDIDTLLAAARTTRRYTNKVVAHRDIKGVTHPCSCDVGYASELQCFNCRLQRARWASGAVNWYFWRPGLSPRPLRVL